MEKLRIQLAGGQTIVCNPDDRLVGAGSCSVAWRRAGSLTIGDHISTDVVVSKDEWLRCDDNEKPDRILLVRVRGVALFETNPETPTDDRLIEDAIANA